MITTATAALLQLHTFLFLMQWRPWNIFYQFSYAHMLCRSMSVYSTLSESYKKAGEKWRAPSSVFFSLSNIQHNQVTEGTCVRLILNNLSSALVWLPVKVCTRWNCEVLPVLLWLDWLLWLQLKWNPVWNWLPPAWTPFFPLTHHLCSVSPQPEDDKNQFWSVNAQSMNHQVV